MNVIFPHISFKGNILMYYYRMHEKKRKRNTDLQSDEINAIGFMYKYSYVDIGDRKAFSSCYV